MTFVGPWPLTISYTLWVEWYYLKNNYLTLRSKVKVPWRSLWYATRRPMIMHPHTKYNWPIWKDEKVMVAHSSIFILLALWSCVDGVCKLRATSQHYHTNYVSPSNEGRHIVLVWFFLRFRFFSVKLVRTITFSSFQIGQLYLKWNNVPTGHWWSLSFSS
jgi:hypothetical protein